MPFPTRPKFRSSPVLRAAARALVGGSAALLSGCDGGSSLVVRGEGPVVQEQRVYRPLDQVAVIGKVDLLIHVLPAEPGALPESSGPDTVAFLEGAQDLLGWIETEVDGDTLTIRVKKDARLDPLPSIELQLGRLTEVTVVGSGDLRIEGLTDYATRRGPFALSVTGSCDVQGSGETSEMFVQHVGSGDVDLRGLRAGAIDYSGLGSGDAQLFAIESFDSSVTGSGRVYLHGPVPDGNVSSSSVGSSQLVRVRPSSSDEPR